MTKKIYAVVFIFFNVMYIHAFGKSEARHRRELEQYPITVAPISLRGGIAYDYVFIDTDRIILREALQLTEFNLSTGEQKKIELPEEWAERRSLRLRGFQYDKANNSVHMILLNNAPEYICTYHILYLDNYSWEAIEEPGNQIRFFYYDAINMLSYVGHFVTYETGSGYRRKTYITTYDLQKREIVDRVEIPDDTYAVYSLYLYDNQPKMLATTQNTGRLHYFTYDIPNRTRIDFPEAIINFDSLNDYIPIIENGCFLGVSSARAGSSIVMMNLNNNTRETVALDDFPYFIYNFQQIAESKYSFLVGTSTWAGGEGPQFLCFLDYP